MGAELTDLAAEAPEDSKPPDIRSRSFAYALRAVRLYQFLQGRKDSAGWISGQTIPPSCLLDRSRTYHLELENEIQRDTKPISHLF